MISRARDHTEFCQLRESPAINQRSSGVHFLQRLVYCHRHLWDVSPWSFLGVNLQGQGMRMNRYPLLTTSSCVYQFNGILCYSEPPSEDALHRVGSPLPRHIFALFQSGSGLLSLPPFLMPTLTRSISCRGCSTSILQNELLPKRPYTTLTSRPGTTPWTNQLAPPSSASVPRMRTRSKG